MKKSKKKINLRQKQISDCTKIETKKLQNILLF
jgi:hypothetical protein